MSHRTTYALVDEQDLDDDYDRDVMRAQTETIGGTTYWPVIVVIDGKTPDPDAVALQKENARLKAELTDALAPVADYYDGMTPVDMARQAAVDLVEAIADMERLRKRVAELEGQVTEADEALQSRDADMADLERDYAIQRRQLQRTKPETEGE